MEWQTIETAPRDGAEVLVTYGRQGWVMQLVRYDRASELWRCKGVAMLGLEKNATHWMPLPEPPK